MDSKKVDPDPQTLDADALATVVGGIDTGAMTFDELAKLVDEYEVLDLAGGQPN